MPTSFHPHDADGFSVTVDRTALRRAIRRAQRLVPRLAEATLRHQALWLTVSDASVTVEAGSDTESIAQQLPLLDATRGTGAVAVPIRVLSRMISLLTDGPVELSANDGQVTVAAGSFTTNFPALSADEVDPPFGPVEQPLETIVPAAVLSAGFNHLALALGHNLAWGPAVATIELSPLPRSLRFAATDRQQLALVEIPSPHATVPATDQPRPLLLPFSALNPIAVLLPTEGQIKLGIGEDQADFTTGELTLRCRLQHDPYPDYTPILSTETTRRIVLSRTRLATAVERVAVLAERFRNATVWLQLGADEVRVRATDLEIGEAIETRPATTTGGPCELGLYLWGFVAMIRRLRGSELTIEFGRPDKPITIYTAEHPMFRYHVMPLSLDPPPSRIAG